MRLEERVNALEKVVAEMLFYFQDYQVAMEDVGSYSMQRLDVQQGVRELTATWMNSLAERIEED